MTNKTLKNFQKKVYELKLKHLTFSFCERESLDEKNLGPNIKKKELIIFWF